MRCPNCGCEIADDSVYCLYCATPVESPKRKEEKAAAKQERNMFVTIWLWLMIIFNLYNGINGASMLIRETGWGYAMRLIFIITGILDLVMVFGAARLLAWKKDGFWIIVAAMTGQCVATIVIGVIYHMPDISPCIPALAAFVATAILCAALYIPGDGEGKSCWKQLK